MGSVFWIGDDFDFCAGFQGSRVRGRITLFNASRDGCAASHAALHRGQPANLKLVEQLIARRPDMRLLTAVNGNLGIELARNLQPRVNPYGYQSA